MSCPSGIDHSLMVLSSEPDARTLPSGLKDSDKTLPLWFCMRGVGLYLDPTTLELPGTEIIKDRIDLATKS